MLYQIIDLSDIARPLYPQHLILCLEPLGHTLTLCHLLRQQEHLLRWKDKLQHIETLRTFSFSFYGFGTFCTSLTGKTPLLSFGQKGSFLRKSLLSGRMKRKEDTSLMKE